MQAHIDKITAAAKATTNAGSTTPTFREVAEELPDEIDVYPGFYQYGRTMDLDMVSAGERKDYEGEYEYECWIIDGPRGSWANLDTYRSAFLSRLADGRLAITGVRAIRAKWLIAGDEVFVDRLTIRVTGGFKAAQT